MTHASLSSYKSGHVSEVEGDGVVGEHPIMNAESQSFNCKWREMS